MMVAVLMVMIMIMMMWCYSSPLLLFDLSILYNLFFFLSLLFFYWYHCVYNHIILFLTTT